MIRKSTHLGSHRSRASGRPTRVLMLLQNSNYSDDGRVIREANALRDSGYEVTVICPRGPSEPRCMNFANGVRAYQFTQRTIGTGYVGYIFEYGYAMAMMFGLSLYILLTSGFDIIHAHNPPDFFIAFGVFYKLFRKRFVFDNHDLAPEMYEVRFDGGSPLMHRLLLLFERLSCRWSDQVITVNESHKRILVERAGIPGNRVTVVRNGPENQHFAEVAAHSSLTDTNKIIIGYVGEMGPLDGIDFLLRALRTLLNNLGREDWLCVLVGDGEAFESLQKLAIELGLADHIRFVGRVGFAEVVPFIQAMDICTIPDPANAYTTHCTLIKTMEYMAQRKPIVAFDLIETRCSAGESAVYIADNDELAFAQALADLIVDPKRRDAMGRAGRARVESQLAWRHSIPSLLAAYDRITGKPAVQRERERQVQPERPAISK